MVEAIVIGGGFYGCAIAIHLAEHTKMRNILLVERESALMTRASYNNQARIHNGYHYPRSFTTAYRSRVNLPRFMQDWPSAVKKDFTKLYAIARHNSKVTAKQFQRFCRDIGASVEPADLAFQQLFERRLIEEVFLAEEYAFDSAILAKRAEADLAAHGIQLALGTAVEAIQASGRDAVQVDMVSGNGIGQSTQARYVFNCTYSGLNQLSGDFPGVSVPIKHEVTELALVSPPASLVRLGITVMDGPFFSLMPFPARGLHTLSHVRYTPHFHWHDKPGLDPYRKLNEYECESRVDRMLRDAARYLPNIAEARHVDSLFEIKTVLTKNEGDDGRPILFEQHIGLRGCYSVLGAKIDNIYDIIQKLDQHLREDVGVFSGQNLASIGMTAS